jgi:hypothetical protein
MFWTPTPEEIDRAGDALLEALRLVASEHRRRGGRLAMVGDLAIEATSINLDWERVGYVVRFGTGVVYLWTIGRRLVRWSNAIMLPIPIGAHEVLQSFPRPTREELMKAFDELAKEPTP